MIKKNCDGCTICCDSLTFGYKKPLSKSAVKFYKSYGCKLYYNAEKKLTIIKVPLRCRHVTDNGCAIYENRPEECRMLDCDKHPLFKYEYESRQSE